MSTLGSASFSLAAGRVPLRFVFLCVCIAEQGSPLFLFPRLWVSGLLSSPPFWRQVQGLGGLDGPWTVVVDKLLWSFFFCPRKPRGKSLVPLSEAIGRDA